jgi:hypothetical protein
MFSWWAFRVKKVLLRIDVVNPFSLDCIMDWLLQMHSLFLIAAPTHQPHNPAIAYFGMRTVVSFPVSFPYGPPNHPTNQPPNHPTNNAHARTNDEQAVVQARGGVGRPFGGTWRARL